MQDEQQGLMRRLTRWLDDQLRHRLALGVHPRLRAWLRRPYHAVLDALSGGLPIQLGGCIPARVPAAFRSKWMENYEREQFEALAAWCGRHPNGLFVDIGCSLGYMSCAALFAAPQLEVVAIDPDESSLRATVRLCRYAGGRRLTVIRCLVGDAQGTRLDRRTAVQQTQERLARGGGSDDPDAHQYRDLRDPEAGRDLPIHPLDALLADPADRARPLLVKCDVEGGEWSVLDGARDLLRTARPTLLLSVHPRYLPNFGHTREEVADLLAAAGYCIRVLGVDHEEHWLCEPA